MIHDASDFLNRILMNEQRQITMDAKISAWPRLEKGRETIKGWQKKFFLKELTEINVTKNSKF